MLSVDCLDPDLRTAVVIRPTDVTTRGKHIESARPAIQVVGVQAEVQPPAHETTFDQHLGIEQIVQRQHSRHSATQHAYSEAVVTVREMDQIHHAPVPLIRHRSPAHPVD